MSDQGTERERYRRAYESMVKQAQTGDRDVAASLISDFAQLSVDPHCFDAVGGIPAALVQHIASCLGDWKKRDFQDAAAWFYVSRDAHRPDETTAQHVGAMRAYLLLKARAKGVVAARAGAAAHSGLSDEQVRHMLAKDKPEITAWYKGRSVGVLEAAALMLINKRLHERVLNPPRKKYQRRP